MRCPCGLPFGRNKEQPQKEVVVEKHYIPVILPATDATAASASVPKSTGPSKEGEPAANQAVSEAAPPEKSSAISPETTAPSAKDIQAEEEAQPEKSSAIPPEITAPSAKDIQAEEEARTKSVENSTAEVETTSPETMTDQLKGAASGIQNTVTSGAEKASSAVQNPTSAASGIQNTVTSGAEKASSAVQNPTSVTQGTQDWDAMTEEQKKQAFDSLPAEQKEGLTYYEWIKQGYYHQKENWMPWIEDQYLKWFTKDNKTSYATKEGLDKTKVTGIAQVDTLQDSVNHTISGQVGQGGLLQPVGDMASKEGVNRAERGGKDDSGSYAGAIGGYASNAGGSLWSGAKSASGYVGGMFGGKKEDGAAPAK